MKEESNIYYYNMYAEREMSGTVAKQEYLVGQRRKGDA